MGNRSAKFITTLFASIVAGAPLAAVSSQSAPSAPTTTAAVADDCLASPKATAPQGQHWFYRLDRASKRKCWYLRGEGDKAAQTAQSAQPAAPAPKTDVRSLQDAHAEFVPQPTAAANAPASQAAAAPAQAAQSAATADSSAQQPAIAARWPDNAGTMPQTSAAPDAQAAQPAPAPVALAAADAPAERSTGSLQMLLLVIVGALALAGIIGSVIYRFAGSRLRVQADDARRVRWDDREQDEDLDRAPWLETAHMRRPLPVDFDLARRPPARHVATSVATAHDLNTGIAPQLATIDVHVDEAQGEAYEEAHAETYVEETEIASTQVEQAPLEPAHLDEAEQPAEDDAVDIDVITKMLERLAQDGPRLTPSSPEAGSGGYAQTRRGQSAARA